MSQCKKFAPNIFHKTKCTNCFRQKEEHSAEALECNRASRSIARSGYLFVAPDWDFSVPLNRTKRWQRRWFVLYDDGELNYSVDEHPDTIPQGSVDMTKVMEVTGAEQITGHPHSLALTSPDRVTFVKAASREDARWWAELLAVFPRRHKRNATFPGGRASPSLPQLGRSASPQPPRPSRHFSTSGPSPRANFETPPLKEERESPPKEEQQRQTTTSNSSSTASSPSSAASVSRPEWLPVPTKNVTIENSNRPSPIRNEYLISSGSPPTRDKLRCDDKARARRDWRNERLRDIATALTDRSPESSLALPAESLLHLKKGWLWLKTADGESVRRWVVLCGHSMNIYQEQQDEHNTPEIAIELSSVTSYNETHTESKYGFEIKWTGGSPLVLSAVTSGIRSNWLAALKKAAPISPPASPIPSPPAPSQTVSSSSTMGGASFQSATNSPITTPTATTPLTPRSLMMFSSDEEYRTASEGGRRGSEDWGELPPSPPPPSTRTSLNRVKDRTRLRPNRLPRCQSRQSTLDSTSTDELDCAKVSSDGSNGSSSSLELMNNTLNKRNVEINDLQTQLNKAVEEVKSLEEEIARLKKFQAEAMIQEKKATEMMLAFERTERELNQRNSQAEMKFSKEQRHLQRLLYEAEENAKTYENRCQALSRDLQTKQRISASLQEEIKNSNEKLLQSREENDRLVKRLQELQGRLQDEYEKNTRQIITKNLGPLGVDSLTELINIDLDVDIDELGPNEIKEYCLDLRGRFERAVLEIRAVKKELRESYEKCDNLELANFGLLKDCEVEKQEHKAEVDLFVARLEHLTSKLNAVEKQLRLKSKGESKDKRRSLSLKGRESFSINKEVEDKVTELEAKILALERSRSKRSSKYTNRRDRSSERSSPIDDRQLRRLRRKSLDSATASEPMKLLMRLSTLENKVTNVDEPNAADTGSSNVVSHITCSTPNSNNCNNRSTLSVDAGSSENTRTEMGADDQDALSLARAKIKECLCQVNLLRNNLNASRRSASPGRDTLAALEQNLNQLGDIFDEDNELSAITSSAATAVKQLQRLLSEKLSTLAERKRQLRETNRLDSATKLEILAEKVAYEKILVGRLQEALLSSPNENGETICDRLVNRELKETVHLMTALQNKLTAGDVSIKQMYSKCKTTGETSARQMSACKTSVTYLTNVLARCLTTAARDFACARNFIRTADGSGEGSARVKLLRSEQNKLNALLQEYKTVKLPQLAEALATDTVAMSSSADRSCSRLLVLPEETVEDFSNAARNTVNAELIATEINHVLLKTAQMYQSNTQSDHMYFFSFFAAERAALELWSDSVADRLYEEINKSIGELTDLYQSQLTKLQRQNWRRRTDSERNAARMSGALLQDFADIVAHKALVDARIDVLTGQADAGSTETTLRDNSNTNLFADWLDNDRCWDHLDAAANQTMVQITNENQSLVEAEFTCMLDRFSEDCYALIDQYHQPELDQVVGYLNDLSDEMDELRKHTNSSNNSDFEFRQNGGVVKNWMDVCQRCRLLRDKLKEVSRGLERTLASRGLIRSQSFKRFESLDDLRPTSLGTEYLTQVENLRASYRCALASCKERHQEKADIEQLQNLCERVLAAMEQWHRRTVQEMREAHAQDVESLRQDKEQALAEETQATLAALDAMRKAHEAEVQREVARFKQEFARQQRDDILDLSERLSVKCLETAALEEQLRSATRQLTHAQQHILQLERRNPQLSPMQN